MVEVMIYGEIGEEIRAQDISEQIRDESEILVRINSYGGDVFEAQAIYNLLKPLNVRVKIDGICASAATLIACSGKEVSMPVNGIYMIHLPATMLFGYYNTIDLEKTKTRLDKITATILTVYNRKTKIEEETLRKMLSNETWLTAEEAKSQGFIDTILERDPEVENRVKTIKMLVDEKKVKAFMERQNETEQSLFEKFKNWLKSEGTDSIAVENERKRMETLNKVETESTAQKAIIELAKKDGRTLDQIQPELDAIGIAEKATKEKQEAEYNRQAEYVLAAIRDYMSSNAESVKSQVSKTKDDPIRRVVTYAKELSK